MKIWVVVNEFRAQLTMLGIYRGSFKGLDFKVYATIGINRKYLILEKIKLPQLTRKTTSGFGFASRLFSRLRAWGLRFRVYGAG